METIHMPSGSDEPTKPADTSAQPTKDAIEVAPEAKAGNVVTGEIVPDAFAPVSAAEAMSLALSPSQRTAIELLTSGRTMAAAAVAAGVNRSTLHRWFKGDAAFVAAFNAWQRDVLATSRGRLLSLSDLAVATVARAMNKGDAKTAVAVLKSLGVMDRPVPGATDPAEVERQQLLEQKKSNLARRKEENRVLTDEILEPM